MTEISDRYRKLATLFTAKVEGVDGEGWSAPSPCEGWSARDLLGHVVGTTGIFFGLVGREAPDGPSVDDDPIGAWVVSRDAMQGALDDTEFAGAEYEGMFGRSTFEVSVDRFICADLVIHNWDLSRATGQDEQLDPDEVHAVFEAMAPLDEALRGPGVFGPKIEPPDGADEQTQMLSFLGRQV